jgi:predicted dehydrogenase
MWLGPAPWRRYNPNRCIYHFRWFWDYAGGKLTDWGTHLIDVVQWAMGLEGPVAVSASGGKLAVSDNRETPDTLEVLYEYPGFVMTYTYRGANGHPMDGRGYGIQFYGSNGTLFVDRGGFELMPEAGRAEVVRSGGSAQSEPHARSFLECVKSRQRPSCDVEVGHRSTSAPHLGNIALWTGRRIRWDAKTERIIGDEEANKRLSRPYRKPWRLPA